MSETEKGGEEGNGDVSVVVRSILDWDSHLPGPPCTLYPLAMLRSFEIRETIYN
jgi:hypothetical protein